MRKSRLVSLVRRGRLFQAAVWLAGAAGAAGVAGVMSCGDAPIYTRMTDGGVPGEGMGGAGAIGDGTADAGAAGGHRMLASEGQVGGGVGGGAGRSNPSASVGGSAGAADAT